VIALQLKDVRKNFGKTEIIRGVDLTVQAGERVAIIGPNGAGKSTLFNLISGRFEPSSGEIWLGEHRIDGKKPFEINRLGLSRSFQITNIFPKLSVFENLRCAVLWKLGYKYTFFKFLADLEDANDRAEALMERIRLDKKTRCVGRQPHICRTTRTRDRYHLCRRCRCDFVRRTHRWHEQERNQAFHSADP